MTTEQPTPRRGRLVLGPLSAAGTVGLLLLLAAAFTTGPAAAAGVAIGVVMVCAVFAFGAVVLGVVATLAPAASLLVALLTYTLQVVLVGVVYVALNDGGALDGPIDPRWLSAAVIACTLAWTWALVATSMRARQPLYDLPSHGKEASVR